MSRFANPLLRWCCICLFLCFAPLIGWAEEHASFQAALESITTADLRRHCFYLADDTFEGREAGSRGGRVAGGYLARELEKHGLVGGGAKQVYFQDFEGNSRNILGLWEGSDPELAKQVIVFGAHYDHVGYGSATNSFGPIGRIHNGADDNASGTSGLLEIVQAMTRIEPRPKRTILFALWDGEEKGLLGSKHWVAHPTLPLSRVKLMLNMDMIGRLRDNKLEMGGSRSAAGLRTLVTRQNQGSDLLLDFTWELKDNSDHHPFFARKIPVLMSFTGLHDDYHRPSDDAEKLNTPGMHRVAQLMFCVLYELAQTPELPGFRAASEKETPELQKQFERPLPALPARLGVHWNMQEADGDGVRISRVLPQTAASEAGLRIGDRITHFAGRPVNDGELFRSLVLTAESPVAATVERASEVKPLELQIKLTGKPIRMGFSWRVDEADAGSLLVSRVVPGSPADRAGLQVADRILEISGHTFTSEREFQELLGVAPSPAELTTERMGQLRTLRLEVPAEQGILSASRLRSGVN